MSNLIGNRPMEETMQRALDALGPGAPPSTKRTGAFAEAIRETLTEDDIAATFRRIGMEPDLDLPLCDFIAPLDRPAWAATARPMWATCHWRADECRRGSRPARSARRLPHLAAEPRRAKRPMAHKGMVHAAR